MYVFILPLLLLTANAAPVCKDLNPNTDSVNHPDSDPACGTGGALAVPQGCVCKYFMKDKDERGCPINYYVQCTLLNKQPIKEEKPDTDEFVISGHDVSGYGVPAAAPPPAKEPEVLFGSDVKPEEAPKQLIIPCDLARADALEQQKLIPDIPVPSCSDDGKYETAQCFFGGCNCVDPDTGLTIPGSEMGPETMLADAQVKCAGQGQPGTLTKCQQDREAALAQVEMIADLSVPACTDDGQFEKTQCHPMGGCRCVDPETGDTIPGSEMMPGTLFPDAQAKCDGGQATQPKTKCQQEREEALAQVQMIPDLPVPGCTEDGKFEKTQCPFPAGCRCVDPETGETIPGSGMSPEVLFMDAQDKCEGGQATPPKTKCEQERDDALAKVEMIADLPVPGCTEDGKFEQAQCPFPAGCRCVDPETGETIPDSHMTPDILFPDALAKCQGQAQQPKTKCEQERDDALAQADIIADLPVPACTADGKYEKTQCSMAGCRCVDPETGDTIPGSETGPDVQFMDAKAKCEGQAQQPKSKCQQEREEALAQVEMIPDLPVPSCTEDGKFEKTQCFFPGICNCVNPETGEKIPGSEMGPEAQFVDAQAKCEGGLADQPKSKCQQEREEALAQVQMIPDLPVPSCTDDGKFVKTQCAPLAGCRCVDPETGETVPGSHMAPEVLFPDAQAQCEGGNTLLKTVCQQQRDEALSAGMIVGMFVPSCDDAGEYEAMQCHGSTGHCWCVDNSGAEMPDTRKGPGDEPPVCLGDGNGLTDCLSLQKDALRRGPMVGMFLPRCDDAGNWEPMQCHESTGQCWCVDVNGSELQETRVQPGEQPPVCLPQLSPSVDPTMTKCQKDEKSQTEFHQQNPEIMDGFIPTCTDDGQYRVFQCHFAACYCVDPDTGEANENIPVLEPSIDWDEATAICQGQIPPPSPTILPNIDPVPSEIKNCAAERDAAMGPDGMPAPGAYVPKCNDDGSYTALQCHGSTGQCWCVDSSGVEVGGSRVEAGQSPPCADVDTSCAAARDRLTVEPPMPGLYVPTCDNDGNYEIVQCHGSTGYCWCVDALLGNEIDGTRLAPGFGPLTCDGAEPQPQPAPVPIQLPNEDQPPVMGAPPPVQASGYGK